MAVDWASGGLNRTSFPTEPGFGVRKVEAFVWPADNVTYAVADIVNYSDPFYPDSYSSEIGIFSSADGRTGWQYHGIIVPRGRPGAWDGGGVASPGAAAVPATDDGHPAGVVVGYAAEHSPSGGINRGIGVARAPHPLGPYTKDPVPVASPTGICGGSGRCDDVIIQARPAGAGSDRDSGDSGLARDDGRGTTATLHLYHSVKGSNVAPGDGIRHLLSTDGGRTFTNSTLVLSTALQPGTRPAESIAGKYFPGACSGTGSGGAMVLITDGGPGNALHAYVSRTPGSMVEFDAAAQTSIDTHPNVSRTHAPGSWANLQIAFFPDPTSPAGDVVSVGYTVWQANAVPTRRGSSAGMTMALYAVNASITCGR
eukprot:g881.t1